MKGAALTSLVSSLLPVLLCLGTALTATAQEAANISAKLKMADTGKIRDVILTHRKDDIVYYRFKGAEGVINGSKLSDIAAARLDLKYDETALDEAAVRGNWLEAAKALFPAVLPALQFLDLPDEETPRLAMNTASYLMRAGAIQRNGRVTTSPDNPAVKEYLAAHRILTALAESPHARYMDEANWRSVTCLIMAGQLEEAEHAISRIPMPDKDDDGYAYSCLAQCQLYRAKEDPQQAMTFAVQSLAFNTKDIDTFPEALFLAAQCYKDLEEWYRARDTYFEVAQLFRLTDWFEPAVKELKTIMETGRTSDEEKEELHRVFFGITEDVNARVNEFLASLEQDTPSETSP